MSQGEEKTEKPTDKKKKESRKEGQVPRTQELGAWAAMLVAGMAMPLMMRHEVTALQGVMTASLRAIEDPTEADALVLLGQGASHAFKALLLLGSAVMVIGVCSALAQGGFYLATKTVQPKLSKLDPIKGAKRVFGLQALWEGAKMLLKCILVAVLVKGAITAMIPLIGGMVPIDFMLRQTGEEALVLIRNVAIAGLIMAVADYAMVKRRMGKQTRMTKEEVKQEHKQQEGDPMLKGAIRSRQLAMSRNRMMADITSADVVLVNPTHVAVALRYDPDAGAPTVVARGAGVIAARIREVAGEADVPLVRDVPLARALYASTQVGQEIPAELFAAVAQVLAFVISRRNQGRVGGTHRSPRHESELGPVPVAGRRRRIPSGPVLATR